MANPYSSPHSNRNGPTNAQLPDATAGTRREAIVSSGQTLNADLGISVSAPATTYNGAELVYVLTIHNEGPDTCDSVVVGDYLDCAVYVTTVTTTAGTVNVDLPNPNWCWSVGVELENLPAGQTETVTIYTVVQDESLGQLTNEAYLFRPSSDLNAANNSAETTTTKVAQPTDLHLTASEPKTGSQGVPYNVIYAAYNAGPLPALDAVLTATLPETVEFISAVPDSSTILEAISIQDGLLRANLGTIPPETTATVSVQLRPFATGVITETAYVTSHYFDPTPSDNITSTNTWIEACAQPDFQAQSIADPLAKYMRNSRFKIEGKFGIENTGAFTTQTITVQALLSLNKVPSNGDTLLKTWHVNRIKPGSVAKLRLSAKLPDGVSPEGKYVLLQLDAFDQVPNELRKSNNLIVFARFP